MPNNLRYKILIIEDDPGISVFLKTSVSAAGYDAFVAKTGTDALHLIASQCPDCILLDLGLPDMDGSQIIRSVRGWTQTPIIVVSARSMEEDKAAALDEGADDYITKPFGAVELLARIRAALRHTRTTAEKDEIGLTDSYVIVRQTQMAEIGDIVVALYDGLNNLKVLDYDTEREQYCLLSRNPDQKKYAPIYVTDLQVQGVAVGVYHKLK